ncbi:MAG: UDP-N-acetylmuramoyl-L-alanine--D-glutamate ligase [Actinobacteria bacterium]|nr:UDP-N-acetylmuramoyl-L-alanine--D-glutamate ligase [Actinomycetota bacterium]MBU1944482.1 UDP-N-acetylmuramoyl-L-alanine--D-glutamate ligase [Actinomycetota bacterium]MBU2688647.1 UDP-N-acetylmuramoyl-L-alanine--D-glutamate ligase [Actinomycetota bacterium]
MIEMEGRRVLVVGLATSGYEAAAAVSEMGAHAVVVDSATEPARLDGAAGLQERGVEVRLGVAVPDDIHEFDLVVTSPGVPGASAVLQAAAYAGVPVISELELGFGLLESNTMVAVTGTNGKTTTTSLVAAILAEAGLGAATCGNIGTPITGLRGAVADDTVLVAEVSSFQLAYIVEFRAAVCIVLNMAPDHFDWHRDLTEYQAAKMRLVENMRPEDWLVYNRDDEFCARMAASARGRLLAFSSSRRLSEGIFAEGGVLEAAGPFAARIMDLDEIALPGGHNLENVMAAAGAALILGVAPPKIREAVRGFEGLEHRTEFVDEVAGVSFYNDSKATNPHAALSALKAFEGPLVPILGGRNKGLEFSGLAAELCRGMSSGRIRGLVLVGQSAQEIDRAVGVACPDGRAPVETVGKLPEAVRAAHRLARGEGAVVYTPACASFDMFTDYKERGRAFKDAVRRFKGEADAGG